MDEFRLSDVLSEVRKSLMESNQTREQDGAPRLFMVTEAELEVKFVVEKEANREGGIGFDLWVLSPKVSAARKVSQEHTHTLKMKLAPIVNQRVSNGKTTFDIFVGSQVVEVLPGPHTPTIKHDDPLPIGQHTGSFPTGQHAEPPPAGISTSPGISFGKKD